MFNPPKLHNHELKRLATCSDRFMDMLSILMEKAIDSKYDGGTSSHGRYHSFLNGSSEMADNGVFNVSMKHALDAIFGHQMIATEVLDMYAKVTFTTLYCIVFVVSLIFNGLVCFVVFRQCGKKNVPSQGPSPRNLYIVNLAIANIMMSMVSIPYSLWAIMSKHWSWGLAMCKIVPVAQGANITVSACTITAIALDRYFTIVRNPRGSIFRCSVAKSLILIWMVSFVTMVPIVLYQNLESIHLGNFPVYKACVEKWPFLVAQQSYTVCLTIIQFGVPFAAISLIHIKISSYLTVHLNHPAVPSRDINCRRVRRELSRNRRTMYILTSIAVAFAVSWLPLTLFTLCVEFHPELFKSPEHMYLTFGVVHLIAMSSTCTNPLLYGWLNTNFRRDISSIFRQVCYCGTGKPPPRRKRHPSVATDYRGPNDRRPGPGSEMPGRRHHHDPETTGLSMMVKSERRFSTSYLTTLTTVTSGRSQPVSSVGRVENV
ncbi:neuropeptide Y receptor type 6-like [Adelges cooleyi]|uniref:neuropeptide Y receptor type 6-like n=1 Tax=Adelges cooleyi TaxID=133065 RepID=UPI00217FBB9D|nr:neuropeptide Y receptor type 6-like [Adelges cooleyi]